MCFLRNKVLLIIIIRRRRRRRRRSSLNFERKTNVIY